MGCTADASDAAAAARAAGAAGGGLPAAACGPADAISGLLDEHRATADVTADATTDITRIHSNADITRIFTAVQAASRSGKTCRAAAAHRSGEARGRRDSSAVA